MRRLGTAVILAGALAFGSASVGETAHIDFAGGQLGFTGAAGGTEFVFGPASVTGSHDPAIVGWTVEILGTYTLGAEIDPLPFPNTFDVVNPAGAKIRVFSGATFLTSTDWMEGDLDLVDITQLTSGIGGTNAAVVANVSNVTTSGYPYFLAFGNGGIAWTTFQFTSSTGSLSELAGLDVGETRSTSFSGSVVPVSEPGSIMLLGSGLLGLAAAARRRMGK